MKNIPGFVVAYTDKKVRDWAKVGLTTQAHNYLNICEQLRFIYDTVEELPDEDVKVKIIELLIDAFIMGKKMQKRLLYYKKKYADTTGHHGSNIIHLTSTKKRKRLRKLRNI